MKRLFVTLAAVILAAGIASAQDFNAAAEAFNNGGQALETNKQEALAMFRSALEQASALDGDEAAELVAKCKDIIPPTLISIAKEAINGADYDGAVASLNEACALAGEYGQESVANEAKGLISTAYLRKGTTQIKEKDFTGAAASLKYVVDADPTDGQAALLYGQALMQGGDNEGAIAALTSAAENGKKDQAGKLLGNLYLKEGSALLKAGKSSEAIEALQKSNEWSESANAYKLIASAYTKLGKSSNAISSYKKYLEISPDAKDASDVKFTIAAAAQKAGDKATAIEYYKMLSSDAKYSAQAAQQLGVLQK